MIWLVNSEGSRTWDVSTDEGLADFYDASFDEVYRCAIRLTRGERAAAEDLVHDAYAVLVAAVERCDVDDVGIGLMVTTIRRRFLNTRRSADRERRRIELFQRTESVSVDAWSASGVDLSALSRRERAALIFRYVDNLPVAEVAELLDSSVRATESLLQRAKRKARRAERGRQ